MGSYIRYIYIYIHIWYTHTHIHTYIYIYICALKYLHVYIHIHICIVIYMYVYVYYLHLSIKQGSEPSQRAKHSKQSTGSKAQPSNEQQAMHSNKHRWFAWILEYGKMWNVIRIRHIQISPCDLCSEDAWWVGTSVQSAQCRNVYRMGNADLAAMCSMCINNVHNVNDVWNMHNVHAGTMYSV